MIDPFLKLTANYIYSNYKDTAENLCIILPNKRGALFLKKHLIEVFSKTMWLPTIISAEDLIAELSELKTLEDIDLMCYLYDSYKIVYGPKAESFESFAKWGQLILQDFNEIDRYLANSEQLYENLKDIKEIENWSLGEEVLSEYQLNYLEFMNSLGAIYKHYSSFLIENKWAYQGLAYKQAVANIKSNIFEDKFHKLIFCGFNALNAAELKLFYRFYEKNKADILWDVDKYYFDNPNQEAGLFLRANFELFKQRNPLFIQDNFKTKKEIQIVSVPKQIGQAQVVKQVLQKYIDNNIPLDKVAVVLANEKLLWPVLQQLPPAIEHVNITMEYPLKYTSTYGLIDILLQIQLNLDKQTRKQKTLYHKDLLAL
jgi:ATP-dependent helicase/nuclease subunit B